MQGSRRRPAGVDPLLVRLLHTSFDLQVPQLVGRRPGGGDWAGCLRQSEAIRGGVRVNPRSRRRVWFARGRDNGGMSGSC